MLMSRILCRVTPRQVMTSRLIASTLVRRDVKTPIQEWGWAYLQRQKALGRPISPHLTVYQPQLTWMFVIAFPIIFHTLNGIRFIGFDLAKGVENTKQIYKTGYLVLGLSAIIAAAVVIAAWPSNEVHVAKKH
ncbi:succinate dehydrogenase cytochrome b subunit [Ancylostoma duodenale]|uniref:Succinate dehydrogenase cytochrome b subunit n=1 Tax=Ancylostoma duodenale TaxID=51022 RepID=A0A0C2CT32_9BILA|nr:succinate dehydrogenase cytochrome b subunit [Ancylostoma duodenale]